MDAEFDEENTRSSPLVAATLNPASSGGLAPSNKGRSSSPLFFPGSSPLKAPSNRVATSPLRQSDAHGRQEALMNSGSSEPLFFPSSNAPTPRASRQRASNQRGDIHPSMPNVSPSLGRRSVGGSEAAHSDDQALTHQTAPSSDHNAPAVVLWGTYVTMNEAMGLFKKFLTEFKVQYRKAYDKELGINQHVATGQRDGEVRLYEEYLRTMRTTHQTNLNLDMTNLAAFPPTRKLERWLRSNPQEVVPMCDQVLKDCMIELAITDNIEEADLEEMESRVYKIRPFGSAEKGRAAATLAGGHSSIRSADEERLGVNMRDLGPADIDKLVTVKGLVIRATPMIPDMKVAFFRCQACSHTLVVDNDRGKITEPTQCPREVCGVTGSMSLIHNRCEFADRQVIRLQETPDAVPDGQTPHTVSLCVYDELVDLCKPGDRVAVTGIFRSIPVRVNPRQRRIKSLFKTYLDVLHIQRNQTGKRMAVDPSTRSEQRGIGVGGDEADARADEDEENLQQALNSDLDEQVAQPKRNKAVREEALLELSKREDIYELLARSLAPSIWEMDDVKKGILLQLFGGTNKTISSGGGAGGPRYRGDINVLLVGDPGTSKSQILQYVHKLSPRGVYTSGKGSSAVGLTAYVTRDPDSKQLVLESGALVLSDGGVCCIDEFDKMSDATRSVLHEVMEQQTVSIAKAGIITTLNARTSILAAANPVGSKYNLKWPITRNIDLPPTLISRFDLLYLVLDKIDESNDRRLAKHLVNLYLEDRPETGGSDILPVETLTAYVSYARERIHPKLTEGASELLVSNYVSMRAVGYDAKTSDRRITATTRQLESMIRLSEAHARMRYSDKVEEEDVTEAARLIREALKESATDPTTGLIDLDLLQTGQGSHQRKMQGDLRKELLSLLENIDPSNRGLRTSEVLDALQKQSTISIESVEVTECLKALEAEGSVKLTGEKDKRVKRTA